MDAVQLRVGTFNVENLFARFRFSAKLGADAIQAALDQGWQAEQTLFEPFDPEHRNLTAAVIKAIDADILGLQEVENHDTLRRFNRGLLDDMGYRFSLCIDGNDSRGIDVALLSRFPFGCIRTHQFQRQLENPNEPVFARDCLEVDIRLPGGLVLTVYVNHFKSISQARETTMAKRQRQAKAVAQILRERFGDDPSDGNWVVLGDLNDYPPSEGLAPLLEQPWTENIVERLPGNQRWTHHFSHGDEYHQLDYILPSRRIARANPDSLPIIERRGLPRRAKRAGPTRFRGVGEDRPKASDHCPMAWDCVIG